MRLSQIVERFYQVEKVKTAKLFLKYLRLKNPNIERDGIIAYSYIRWLDDLVDFGVNPGIASRTLDQEEETMKGVVQGEEFDTESYPYLFQMHQRYGNRILDLFQKFIEGFRADNEIIRTGKPLDEQSFAERTLNHSLPCYQVLSLIAFSRELEFTEDFKNLMRAWSNYDSLIDLREDLSAGLILFPQEELNQHGVDLQPGVPLPPSFRNVYYSLKRKTLRELIAYSSAVERTNLPPLEKFSLQGYFLSRTIKLAMTQYPFTEPEFIVGNAHFLRWKYHIKENLRVSSSYEMLEILQG